MRQEEDRLGGIGPAASMIPHDEVSLRRLAGGNENLDIRVRKARGAKSFGHGLHGRRDGAHRVRRVDRDQLAIDLASKTLMRRKRSLRVREIRGGKRGEKHSLTTHGG